MSVLIDKDTRLLVQGITGREGQFHTKGAIDYGTNVVAGVTPGKAGQKVEGVPVFNTVADAMQETGANATVIFVPPPFAADAILEAVASEIPLVVCITEGIPAYDMVEVMRVAPDGKSRILGPNCPRPHLAREGENRHHARSHPQGRSGRRRVEKRHTDVRSRLSAFDARHRPVDLYRYRRRSRRRYDVRRCARALPGRRRHRCHHHDRRDWREWRGDCCRLHQEKSHQTRRFVHRRPDGASGPVAWATPEPSSCPARAPPPTRWPRSRPWA